MMDNLALESAIRCGDVAKSAKIVENLARRKTCLSIQVEEDMTPFSISDKEISVQICIEDRETAGVHLKWKLAPSDTIFNLKMLMFKRFGFPPEVQKWIVGKRVSCDADTLAHCKDEIFYLYLLPAQCVGLTREMVRDRYGSRAHGLGDTLLTSKDDDDLGHFEKHSNTLGTHFKGLQSNEVARSDIKMQSQAGVGWVCPVCTFFNQPTRPGCEACTGPRPENFVVPPNYRLSKEERNRLEHEQQMEIENKRQLLADRSRNYGQLLATEELNLVANPEQFTCPICMEVIRKGEGVMLRDCLHMFCRECLIGQIRYSDSSTVACPYSDDLYRCPGSLQQREIQSLVPVDLYEKHLSLSLKEAESRMQNTFHCQTPNCIGFCIYEEDINTFLCPICTKENCLTCKAIHGGMSCKQYQEDLKVKAHNDVAAKKTQEKINAMLAKGDAMKCPTCDIIVMKKDGCDWLMCSMCKTEICWVTKGARWGPAGSGDISGGCRCGVDGKTCHPNCQNCH